MILIHYIHIGKSVNKYIHDNIIPGGTNTSNQQLHVNKSFGRFGGQFTGEAIIFSSIWANYRTPQGGNYHLLWLHESHVLSIYSYFFTSSLFTMEIFCVSIHYWSVYIPLPWHCLPQRSKIGPIFAPSKPHLNLAAATALRLELEVLKRKIATRAEETHLLRGKWADSAKDISDEIQKLSRKKKVGASL